MAQVFVHAQPHGQAEFDLGQHALQIGLRGRQRDVPGADARTRAHQRPLRGLVVAAQGEARTLPDRPVLWRQRGRAFAVVADQAVLQQIGLGVRHAMRRQVSAVGEQAHGPVGHALGQQRGLMRLVHTHGHVHLAPDQVLHAVAQTQLDADAGVLALQPGQQRWQDGVAHHVAGRQAHGGVQLRAAPPFCHPPHRQSLRGHGVGQRRQRQGRLGRLKAGLRSAEQRHAPALLQRRDVPPQRGLAAGQGPRRARQAAVGQHGLHGTQLVPAWRVGVAIDLRWLRWGA